MSKTMATLRIKLVLNEGRIGIPLEKLAGIATDTKEFLAMLATDLDLPGEEWIAVNFENGSVIFDCERIALDVESCARGRRGLRAILAWPDPEKVDELKVEFCPIIRSRTNEEKSIQ
jgi:hypothetical protein